MSLNEGGEGWVCMWYAAGLSTGPPPAPLRREANGPVGNPCSSGMFGSIVDGLEQLGSGFVEPTGGLVVAHGGYD